MKAIKIMLGLLSVTVALAVIITIFVLNNLNIIIKDTVENVVPEVTKTAVTLTEVDIELTKNRVALRGFSVANPTGFDATKPILAMQEIVLHMDANTLTDRVKVVREIKIDGIKVVAEYKNIHGTNIQAMANNIKNSSATVSGREKTGRDGARQGVVKKEVEGEQTRFMIETLTFGVSSVELVTEKWGNHSVELPGFSKTNLGDKVDGLTSKQLANDILAVYMEGVKSVVKDEIERLAKSKLKDKLKNKYEEYKNSLLKQFGIGG